MIKVIKDEINIIFKRYGYPELSAKIGIDAGENAIVQYGYDEVAPIDILGYSMNIAAKITSLTGANKVSIGDNVYKSLGREVQREFHELPISDHQWKCYITPLLYLTQNFLCKRRSIKNIFGGIFKQQSVSDQDMNMSSNRLIRPDI
jgi:hypothetical protein